MKLENLNPFADIKKIPLYGANNGANVQSSAWSVHLNDNMNLDKPWQEVGIVGKDYMLVSNKEIVDMVGEVIDASDLELATDKMFWNGKQFMQCYKAVEEIDAEVKVGDNLGIGVMVGNSYDGSTSGRFSIFAYRLLCLNGMMSKTHFSQYRFKHTKSNDNWAEELEKAAEILSHAGENVKQFATTCSKLVKPFSVTTLGELREEYIPKLPVTTFGKVVDRLYELPEVKDPGHTITTWDFLNAATNVLWHKNKQTVADYSNNDYVTTGILSYANQNLIPVA